MFGCKILSNVCSNTCHLNEVKKEKVRMMIVASSFIRSVTRKVTTIYLVSYDTKYNIKDTPFMVNTVGLIINETDNKRRSGIILWVHATIYNIKGLCCRSQYFNWLQNSVYLRCSQIFNKVKSNSYMSYIDGLDYEIRTLYIL